MGFNNAEREAFASPAHHAGANFKTAALARALNPTRLPEAAFEADPANVDLIRGVYAVGSVEWFLRDCLQVRLIFVSKY